MERELGWQAAVFPSGGIQATGASCRINTEQHFINGCTTRL